MTASLRSSTGSFARLIGEPLNAAESSGRVLPRISRASVRVPAAAPHALGTADS
jgi:hypothetical protein